MGLTILPPFWQTGWFRSLAVVIAVALLYGLYRVSIRALAARRAEREQSAVKRTLELRDDQLRPEEASRHKSELVLLVEDNEINQLIAQELMTGAGVPVDFAASGEEALQMLTRNPPEHYAVVLMDLQMPGMDGFSATRAIRANAQFSALPIVALTAHASIEIQNRCAQEGMQGCLSKPFHPAELFAILDRYIVRPVAASAASPASEVDLQRRETPANQDAEKDVALFSPDRALAHLDGKKELFLAVLRRFTSNAMASVATLNRELEQHDLSAAIRTAHTLKGLAATIGAVRLALFAGQLESALTEGQSSAACKTRMTRLSGSLPQTLTAIEHYLNSTTPPVSTERLTVSVEEFLAELKMHLQDNNGRAIVLVERGKHLLTQAIGAAQADQVEALVHSLDFAAAARLIDRSLK